jgi:hypothetical protein
MGGSPRRRGAHAGVGRDSTARRFLKRYSDSTAAAADVLERLDRVESSLGSLPAALETCLSEIGSVWLSSDIPTLGLTYESTVAHSMPPGGDYPDPLSLPGSEYLEWSLDEWNTGSPYERPTRMVFDFAPDELHEAGVSGGTHDIELPSSVADPGLSGVSGYSFEKKAPPTAVQNLRATPDF